VPRDRVRAVEVSFETLKDPKFVAEAEKTRMTLPDPRDHPAQHDRRRPVHARGPQRKAQADPCAKGLAGEPVAISESVASCDHRGEFFLDREIPRESEVIELFKKLVGAGPLPPHSGPMIVPRRL
jgi:hypothetical protein